MTDETIPRRKFLVGAGLAGTAVATGLTQTAPAEAHEGLGLQALREKRSADSLRELGAAIDAPSTSARAWLEHARLLTDAVKAKAEIEKATKLNPNWAEPVAALAALETDSSHKLQWLKTAASLDPRNAARWIAPNFRLCISMKIFSVSAQRKETIT